MGANEQRQDETYLQRVVRSIERDIEEEPSGSVGLLSAALDRIRKLVDDSDGLVGDGVARVHGLLDGGGVGASRPRKEACRCEVVPGEKRLGPVLVRVSRAAEGREPCLHCDVAVAMPVVVRFCELRLDLRVVIL